MPFLAGQSESTTDTITVIGSGPVRVTLNVPYAAVASVKVGQAATVVADGVTTSVPGTVASIGLLPATSSSQSATAYPVTVLVAQPRGGFVDGGAASVSIAVKAAKAAVLVPNSALSTGAVFVMTGGQAVRVPVQTGVVGPLMTEVTSGVTPGQQVVLADMSASLPANSTTTGRGAFGGSGGRPFPQGGFQGGNGGPPPG